MAGCGGAPSTEARSPAESAGQSGAGVAYDVAAHGKTSAALAGTEAVRYDLVLMNDRAVHQDLDQLDPRQGKGYTPLHAFVYVKGRPRSKSPVNSIKPICTPTQCEYLPPRQAGFAERYTISIDDASLAELSADKDVVVISSTRLQLAKAATLNVTLTVGSDRTVVKRIVYGGAQG